jgi:predicted homoserine dehydrogenase-like protein
VYAYAKRDLVVGDEIEHAIGGAEFYGLVEPCAEADAAGRVPLALLEPEEDAFPSMKAALAKGEPLTAELIEIPETFLTKMFAEQREMLKGDQII